MALDFGMALATRKGTNVDTDGLGSTGKALQVCIRGWRKDNSLKGLRIHQGRVKMPGIQGRYIEHYFLNSLIMMRKGEV